MSDEFSSDRLKKKTLLLSYYAQSGNNGAGQAVEAAGTADANALNATSSETMPASIQVYSKDPYDLNASNFEADLFLKKLIKV